MFKKVRRGFEVLCLLLLVGAAIAASRDLKTPEEPELIPLHEAQVLIYLLPEAHQLRSKGMDVGWELETGEKINEADYFIFWVVNAMRKDQMGSVTVGFFAVNKHTGEVLDEDDRPVLSPELKGVQRILRVAHHIDDDTIKKFSNRSQHRPPAP